MNDIGIRSFSAGLMRKGLIFFVVLFGLVSLGIQAAEPVQAQGLLSVITSQEKGAEATTAPAAEPATAQTPAEPSLEQEAGLTINKIVHGAVKARDEFKRILANGPQLRAQMAATLAAQDEDGTTDWVWDSILVMLAGVISGIAALTLFYRWTRKQFGYIYKEEVFERADKLAYLFLRALIMTSGLLVFVAVAGLVVLVLNRGPEAANQTAIVAITFYALFRFLRIVLFAILAPGTANYRLPPFSDHDASQLYWFLVAGAGISFTAIAVCDWMFRLGLPEDAHKLVLIGAMFLTMLTLSFNAIYFRKVIGAAIRGTADNPPLWRRVLAGGWHIPIVLYFIFAWIASSIRLLLNIETATNLVAAPIQLTIAAAAAYGMLVLFIDRVLLPRLDTPKKVDKVLEDLKKQADARAEDFDEGSSRAEARAIAMDNEAARAPFRDLADRGAHILVAFGAIQLLGFFWSGKSLTDGPTVLGDFIEVLLIVFIGYMAYEAVRIVIDQQIKKESPTEQDEEAEVGGAGESRIATLLPIFRNFLLITIFVIVVMLVLSELGVNIAPLFAGAGVVGLAVGFGAQTLIRDIFSGAFYLIDDAFRKGEYIDIGSAKGVVEKISIRSMQLRHHRGALTTVPFGEIQHVQNFSRDWAIMKLAFRVTYDTDVDKMRKIIKKFGQQLLEDEYYGPMFLQPLKSQGITSFEDSAMIARVKFTAKPGKQFELRKVVFAGLQELFEENGIKFAHRQVTVRVANENGEELGPKHMTPDALKAAAAAGAGAAGIIDDEDGAGGGDGGDQL